MRPLLQASLIFVLSLLLTDSAVAQETPRDLLDEQAGFVPAAQLDEIRESFEAHLMREETRQSKLQSDLIKIKANQEIDPVEVEEKLDALRTLEQQWKKNLSADHPRLQRLRRQIDLTERSLGRIVTERQGSVRRIQPPHEGNRHVEELEKKVHAIKEEMAEVRNELRETEDDTARQRLMVTMQFLEKELRLLLSAMKTERKPPDDDGRMTQVHALHDAAERLQANGLPDIAHELHRRAEELEREFDRQHGRPEAVIHEMRQDLERLRDDVRNMHRKLDRILELLDDDRGEDKGSDEDE